MLLIFASEILKLSSRSTSGRELELPRLLNGLNHSRAFTSRSLDRHRCHGRATKEELRDGRRNNGRTGKDCSGTGEGHVRVTYAVPPPPSTAATKSISRRLELRASRYVTRRRPIKPLVMCLHDKASARRRHRDGTAVDHRLRYYITTFFGLDAFQRRRASTNAREVICNVCYINH